MVCIGNSWDELLRDYFDSAEYRDLRVFLKREYSEFTVYPDMYDIFNAFKLTDYDGVKALILGQDPYINDGQAHGLSFSVKPGIEPPPSLINIFKEMSGDIGKSAPQNGCLEYLARQGVMLLNAVLTVRKGAPNSHKNKGWETLTDKVISLLNQRQSPVVFILWGRNARDKKSLITNPRHLVVESAHPSPLSAYNGFFGSKPFSKTNDFLIKNAIKPIEW
ncbi:MAG: uracil-DNA glycosylase [Clostridiales bacterium]|jgi:uracil-DNA glycosylase|nr:uracil-DNA glycosylase [Clostridiales bacterium]